MQYHPVVNLRQIKERERVRHTRKLIALAGKAGTGMFNAQIARDIGIWHNAR